MLSLLCSTSVADTMTMNAGSVTLACLRPAGKTVTGEDAAAAACLEAALYLRLAVLHYPRHHGHPGPPEWRAVGVPNQRGRPEAAEDAVMTCCPAADNWIRVQVPDTTHIWDIEHLKPSHVPATPAAAPKLPQNLQIFALIHSYETRCTMISLEAVAALPFYTNLSSSMQISAMEAHFDEHVMLLCLRQS